MSSPDVNISTSRHPEYMYNLRDWSTWRWIWEGGDGFTRQFLQQYTNRESAADYEKRREITPVPGFAKAALVDIKNAVFHRMGDIVRRGGSQSYQAGVNGQKGRRGSTRLIYESFHRHTGSTRNAGNGTMRRIRRQHRT